MYTSIQVNHVTYLLNRYLLVTLEATTSLLPGTILVSYLPPVKLVRFTDRCTYSQTECRYEVRQWSLFRGKK